MKKSLPVLFTALLVCCILFIVGSKSKANQLAFQAGYEPEICVPNEVLVRFKEDAVGDLSQNKWLIQNLINLVQGKIKTFLNQEISTSAWEPSVLSQRSFVGDPYLFHIKIPAGTSLDSAISFFSSNPYVEYVEKNGIFHLSTTDPRFSEQWALFNDPSRHDIHAPEAWNVFSGSSEVVVAVLDSGIDYNHPDLQANIWTNPNDQLDGVDNDQNGYVDDVHGWNFVAGTNDPLDDYSPVYHGTHNSGIIGAAGNNGIGISGVCWTVKLMIVKIANSAGTGTVANTVSGIDYATSNGAHLSNNSWAFYSSNNEYQSIKDAIRRNMQKSKLFVCAAGNDPQGQDTGWNIDEDGPYFKEYPSNWTLDNILSVLATDQNDHKCGFSFYGHTSVDIGAPGKDILSTKLGGNYYQLLTGTSQAAPHVTGVAALALGMCPGITSNGLKSIVLDGVDKVDALENACASGGRLNAYKVLNALGGTTLPSAPSNLTASPTAWNIIQLVWHDNSNNEVGFEIQKKDQFQTVFIHDNCADMNSTSTVSFRDETIDPYLERTYTYRVRATNKAGISSFTNTASASVPKTVPETPTDFECTSAVYPNVHLDWSDVANNELHYFVERRISGSGPWSVLTTLACNTNSYTDSNVQRGRTYDYRVRANNPIGYSGYSNVVTVEVVDW